MRKNGSAMRICVFDSQVKNGSKVGILWLHGGGYSLGAPEMAGVAGPPLDPARIAVIGARSFEAAEAQLLAAHGVAVFGMAEIEKRGLAAVCADEPGVIAVARKDSPIQTLEDLRGHTLALQRAASTSAYMVPLVELLEAGQSPEILLGPSDEPSPDRVGYVFARSEANIATSPSALVSISFLMPSKNCWLDILRPLRLNSSICSIP